MKTMLSFQSFPLVMRCPMMVTSQALMVMSVHSDAGAAGDYRKKACL